MENNQIFIKNFMKWSIICTISAAPSFVLASYDRASFNALVMILGVVIFIFIYSFITSSKFYIFLTKFDNIYKALKFSFILKIFMAVISLPFTFAGITLMSSGAGGIGTFLCFLILCQECLHF